MHSSVAACSKDILLSWVTTSSACALPSLSLKGTLGRCKVRTCHRYAWRFSTGDLSENNECGKTHRMPYTYNRNAFRISLAAGAALPVLLQAYSTMVCLELFLKEHLPTVGLTAPQGHNVPELLRLLAQVLPPLNAATMNSLSTQLGGKLSSLWCEDKAGGPCKVKATSYPYVRYLRHSSDWSAPHSTDADIADLFNVIAQILHELSKTGRHP